MVRSEAEVEIKRPIEEVWAYLTDPNNLPEWSSLIVEAHSLETPLRKGSKVTAVAKFLGRRIEAAMEVTEYEANKRFSGKTTTPFPFEQTMTFERVDSGTRVRNVGEGEPRGFFKLADPILGRVAQRQSQNDLETVKEILEARVPAEAPR